MPRPLPVPNCTGSDFFSYKQFLKTKKKKKNLNNNTARVQELVVNYLLMIARQIPLLIPDKLTLAFSVHSCLLF